MFKVMSFDVAGLASILLTDSVMEAFKFAAHARNRGCSVCINNREVR